MTPIRVLIIDDSAFARKVLREVLSQDSEIEVVGYARDGLEGLEKIAALKPDVVTLDLIMPELDGIGVLRALQKIDAPKVVIVSVSGSETELAIEALQLGAVELVGKPTALATSRLYELSSELIVKVKAAALARPRLTTPTIQTATTPVREKFVDRASNVKLLVIGTSTGGPQAISEIFRTLPADLPFPVLVALHIPAGYTAPLAARVSLNSPMKMSEAQDGMELLRGHAYIAPGGMHLRVRADRARLFAVVSREPFETVHHPSVDELFSSAAEAVRDGALAVVMTGMGNDGTAGAGAIRRARGHVLAESEVSCVVYGMPRSVIEAGFANAQAPLDSLVLMILATAFPDAPLRENQP